jgi:hypothetical protein
LKIYKNNYSEGVSENHTSLHRYIRLKLTFVNF